MKREREQQQQQKQQQQHAFPPVLTLKHDHFLVRVESDDCLAVSVEAVDVVVISPGLLGVHADCFFEDDFVIFNVGNPLWEVEGVLGASSVRSGVEVGRLVHVDPKTVEPNSLFGGLKNVTRKYSK